MGERIKDFVLTKKDGADQRTIFEFLIKLYMGGFGNCWLNSFVNLFLLVDFLFCVFLFSLIGLLAAGFRKF